MNKDGANVNNRLDEVICILKAAKMISDKNHMIEQAIDKLNGAKRR